MAVHVIDPDKLNTKFCKFTLGVNIKSSNNKSSNFAVYAEMGRRPFYLDIVKSMLLFWHRVENMPFDSLLYNALSRNVQNVWIQSHALGTVALNSCVVYKISILNLVPSLYLSLRRS